MSMRTGAFKVLARAVTAAGRKALANYLQSMKSLIEYLESAKKKGMDS